VADTFAVYALTLFRPYHAGNAGELGWDWDAFCEFMQSIDPGPHAVRPRLPLLLGICLLEDLDTPILPVPWYGYTCKGLFLHTAPVRWRWEALSRI
jgi:hypothetical protein